MTPVRAAGGVVWRPGGDAAEVCLIHRARYDDWTLPKGKLEPGEHPLAAAVREVGEETDLRGIPQVRLKTVSYTMRDGLPKTVEYWSMRGFSDAGTAVAGEVDSVCWLPTTAAARRLTYDHDVRVLAEFATLPPVTAVLTVVRHAQAGKRGTWSGPDEARPLDASGVAQARAVAPLQALTAPRRLLSASPRRCIQTLDPLAALMDLPIEIDSSFDEPVPGQDPDENALAAAARLAELAAGGVPVAVCSQGKVLPDALARLAGAEDPEPYTTPKGGAWLLAFNGDRLVAADPLWKAEPRER
ncbi:8-oxo-dGTP diphosphatase [Micromonospora pattaloongensis]|uniref:8-oxo-dGTP diphosphatase n=1 Tax=Micromonospora pattaloongensis TaxID=405436 RepID=A0A1H3KV08_9ACTN|nr:8-oxo-dGTP diphosphatase [Micromonospora pattaloongensis]